MNAKRKVAILGGARIPFARQNTNYLDASNIDMLTAALKGVVERFGLRGERLGDVAAGAVLKHSRDANISREAALDSGLSPQTPAYDVQQACATSLETAILVGNKIAVGQIEAGIAGGVDPKASEQPQIAAAVDHGVGTIPAPWGVARGGNTQSAERSGVAVFVIAIRQVWRKRGASTHPHPLICGAHAGAHHESQRCGSGRNADAGSGDGYRR